ncbi:periplasmic binding protein-like II [Neocallimastix californiae]|uniref:Periplasmic binding protein-like II n=1 Tax=Neocallimastix californiae TaxID=1754190 RepID=A0A1Y2D8H5_9FUNG|nr:periplasmic binding protein-like II [Neocallimastix californiae]|eukprot:ORY55562.1 periplasmic binding protein-like II [Neocallimastix californiae]
MKSSIINISILTIFINFSYAVVLNFVINSYSILDDAFNLIVNDFNKYSNETNLGITLRMTYFIDQNSAQGYNDYSQTLSLFGKKKNKYDIFAYDPFYIKIFSPYLVELENYPQLKEYFDLYNTDDNKKLTELNNHRYGLPLFMIISVLQSNKDYLMQYNKEIPKTWDDLIETAEYIMKKEKEKHKNSTLIGYNGLFPNNENTLCSLYQIIYSFRKDKDSDIPDFTSQETYDALEELMKIRETISSDEVYRSNEVFNVVEMTKGNILFSNFYSSLVLPNYSISVLPGKKMGINGSILGGFNIGINKNIEKEKIEASIKVIQYLFTERFQKEVIVKQLGLITALSTLYDDEESCRYINCDMMKEIQFYLRPSSTMKDYEHFSDRVLKYFYKYLDGSITTKELQNKISDINSHYSIQITSLCGLIILGIVIILLCCVFFSSLILFTPKYNKRYFKFMSTDFWVLYLIGSLFILASVMEYYNTPTSKKCAFRHICMEIGDSLVFIPLLFKLAVNFPKINKYSKWIEKNRYIFFTLLFSVQFLLSILIIATKAYKIKEINFYKELKNFYICDYNNTVGKIVSYTQISYNIIIYFIICFLIFLEWNLNETFFDVRHFTVVLIIDGINQILKIVFNNLNINNYILYNLLHIIINFSCVLMNHIYIFFIRVIFMSISSKEDLDNKKMRDIIINNRYSNIKDTTLNRGYISSNAKTDYSSSANNTNSTLSGKFSKDMSESLKTLKVTLINYHYLQTPIP